MDERREVVISDLGHVCQPQENIADVRVKGKWARTNYETNVYSGTMLTAVRYSNPQPVELDPELKGWYRIFVGMSHEGDQGFGWDNVNLALTDDNVPMHIAFSELKRFTRHGVQEAYWRAADMTDLRIIISLYETMNGLVGLAWFRFVPMSDEEVAEFKADQARTDTKRIYATNDMHGMLVKYALKEPEEWYSLVKDYAESDVEWLSMENVRIFDGEPGTGDPDTQCYTFPYDYVVQTHLKKYFTGDMLSKTIAFGHQQGLKMCLSVRLGAWGIEYPDDQDYFENRFMLANPQLRCVDRDGSEIFALSYMYPEVQEYMLNEFEFMAKQGCDAVEMICSRGVPYVLFEQPFVDLFMERYGEDPRYLPLDDERVTALRCEVMTGFVRRVRERLDSIRPGIGLHARVQYSVWDAKHVALDVETWAKEHLITAVISYPQRIREVLKGDIWQDADPSKIDLEKYHRYVTEAPESIIYRRQDFNTVPPMEDSRGVLRGPADQQERVSEFMELEKKYGVTVYLEIMPRSMSTEEYRQRALELYRCGCNHISLWDTYGRVPSKIDWTMLRRLGHKDELEAYDSGEGTYFRTCRPWKVAGKDTSRYLRAWGG